MITAERIGENKSRNPKAAPKIPNVRIHPHKFEPSDFMAIEPTIRMIPEDITHTAKANGRIAVNASVPRPNKTQTVKRAVTVPLASIQPERLSFFSFQKDTISEAPDINMEIPIKIASVTRFSSGVNSMVIPSITTNIPDRSSSHFIDLSTVFIINTPLL